ncbi:unnamed protein product [marine sediment metagenome]|uniref:Uncharacterized protein n=1 Tax=marine sediment metagenome TaxID=412755 RepID=X0Z4I8_9ZZZZ
MVFSLSINADGALGSLTLTPRPAASHSYIMGETPAIVKQYAGTS